MQLRDPLRTSGLWAVTRTAAALCSGVFEKAYLAKLSSKICGSSAPAAELTGLAAELFMFAALTVDDWLDNTPSRAGKSAVYFKHGPQSAVLAATCLTEAAHSALYKASTSVPETLRAQFLQSFQTAVLSIQAGQVCSLKHAEEPVESLAIVERLARQRCGNLIASTMSAGAYLSGNTELVPILAGAGTWLGIALQHRNDVQDFAVAFNQTTKSPLADLLNGQPNLVACYLFRAVPHMKPRERQLLFDLHGRSRTTARQPLTKSEFLAVLELSVKYDAAVHAGRRLCVCVQRCRRALDRLAEQEGFDELNDFLRLVTQP
ncbi:MAG TPA: polyprenyl synthetase family protein [Phycisphaerae bacterium]|nr:polyprenyl synthetase family protein [Phycisphaerae bacterium]